MTRNRALANKALDGLNEALQLTKTGQSLKAKKVIANLTNELCEAMGDRERYEVCKCGKIEMVIESPLDGWADKAFETIMSSIKGAEARKKIALKILYK
jgi:hypothetical protein